MNVNHRQIDIAFPLTLTLSRGGREQPLASFSIIASYRAVYRHRFAIKLGTIPPLPAGEGRGEGKQNAHHHKLKMLCRHCFTGSSSIPHFGHLPGLSEMTSGCIGQV